MHLGNHSDRLAFFGRSQPTLKQGARGEAVKTLQKQLNKLGFPTAEDGVFGFKTMATVTKFQASRGLKPDGIVGPATWTALEGKGGGPVARQPSEKPRIATTIAPPAKAATPAPAGTPILKQGAKGAAVKQLQGMLGIKADGIFGAGTRAAVVQFQKSRGLKADGIVGPATWAALRGGAPARVARVADVQARLPKTPVVLQRTPLTVGSKGPAVKELQEDLIKAGYPIKADGIYGRETEDAVRRFQAQQGLATDGKAGQNTQTALEQTTGSRPISPPTSEVAERVPASDASVPVTVPPAGEAKKGLPAWAWALIGVGGAGVLGGLAYFLMRKPSASSRPAAAATAGADFEQMPGGGTIVTGRGIPLARLMALRSMLRLEMVGLQHSGGSIYARVKREFGLKGNKQKVFEQFTAMVEAAKAAHSGGVQ